MVQCNYCKISLARVKNDSIVRCIGTCGGSYHKKCSSKIKSFSDTGMCENCQITPMSAVPLVIDILKTTPEKILAEVNEKLAIVFKTQKTLEGMAEDISFYAEKYQELVEEKEKINKKVKALENKNVYLETCNKALEERITYLENRDKEKNIEIVGMEEQENEILDTKIHALADKLGMDSSNICEVKRVGEVKKMDAITARKKRENKPRSIVITLATRQARDQWLATRKTRQLTNKDVSVNGNNQRIYVNEDLPKNVRSLLWTAKNELKPTYKYIWIQNGRVLIKKDDPEDTKIKVIHSLSDITKFASEE